MNPLLLFLSIYVTLTTLLLLLSRVLPPSRLSTLLSFAGRFLASVLSLALCAAYGILATLALRLVGKQGMSQWAAGRAFMFLMRWVTGVRFEVVEGKEWLRTRPAVFVGNHQSELDILLLGTVFPKWCSVTSKSSLKWTPVLGQFMWLSETVFINRTNHASALHAFASAAEHMHTKQQSVFIFPEGTRSYAPSPSLLPFKKGAFHLAIQAQVPIVPVVAANYAPVLDMKARHFWPGRVPVRVLPPVPTEGLAPGDVVELMGRVRARMEETLMGMGVGVPEVEAERLAAGSSRRIKLKA